MPLGNRYSVKTKTAIPNASVRTMNATPVTIVEAPPAGYAVANLRIHAKYIYATAAFDAVGAGDDLEFRYTDGSGTKLANDVETTGWLDQTADGYRMSGPVQTSLTPLAATKVVARFATGEVYSAAGGGSLVINAIYDLIKL